MEVAAKLSGATISAQKARLVADQIRGQHVGAEHALDILNVQHIRRAAAPGAQVARVGDCQC